MKKFFKQLTFSVVASVVVSVGTISASSFADWKQIGFLGDLNNDKKITIADAVLLTKHLLAENPLTSANGYDVAGKFIGINGEDGFLAEKFLETADINQDGRVDVYDMIILRDHVISQAGFSVWQWEDETTTTTASTTQSSTTTTVSTSPENFISPPIYDLYGSLPSQNEAKTIVFYVDFPDCKYDYKPDSAELENMVFGKANENDRNYPFESISAFFSRSSKGAMNLSGNAYTYTAKNNKSYYENDVWHVSLVDEIIDAFDESVDFSQFDGDNDKTVDAILISVPESAGDDNWWASAGTFGGEQNNRADGMNIGHVIVGNAEIKSADDYKNFNSTYCHEMGHCMGLPDYYLYGVDDFQGMHGSAGFELMDDAICDFGAVSKLMLGWYRQDEIKIYNKDMGKQVYELTGSDRDNSNCVIIPCGELDNNYYSEFFIIENSSKSGNNSGLDNFWWLATGEGVRIYHVNAEITGNYWNNTFKYSSGNDDATNYNNGIRFIRLVNEGTDDTDNFFYKGSVIDSSIPEFNWYDSDGNMTVDPQIRIHVDTHENGDYYITISEK